MEHNPPIPTLQPPSSKGAIHTFLGFDPSKQIVSLSARDPDDVREMPPNRNAEVSVWTLRGVRKVSPSPSRFLLLFLGGNHIPIQLTPPAWRSHAQACQPDLIFALSDTPFTDPAHRAYSQKRLTKSIDRTAAWLGVMLRPGSTPLPPIFVPMAGGASPAARRAFASSLLEPFYGPEAEIMHSSGLKSLDEGVAGYSFDLAPLRGGLSKGKGEGEGEADTATSADPDLVSLIRTSLAPLPPHKPRLINSTHGPHEVLRCITNVGADVFDAAWAQRLAGRGVARDFEFPAAAAPQESGGGGRAIGHNLYDQTYAFDLGSIAEVAVCACPACSPLAPPERDRIRHGGDSAAHTLIDESTPTHAHAHTRAYLHHLLHTHEMGAHTLLAMHNLTVLDRFFEGVREVLEACGDGEESMRRWSGQVARFCEVYDEVRSGEVVERARRDWENVDRARGKGRLAREKEK